MMILNPTLNNIILTDLIGLDTEFNSLDILRSDCLALSITNDKGQTYVLDRVKYIDADMTAFCKKLAKLKIVICHNAKADIGLLYSNFGVLLKNGYCTMLASQIIDNGYTKPENMVGKVNNLVPGPHSLGGCTIRYLNKVLLDNDDKKRLQRSFINLPLGTTLTEEQLEYAGGDTNLLIPLYWQQQKYIKERDLSRIVKLENTLTPVLIKMEFKGSLIDKDKHESNIQQWEIKRKELTYKLDEIILTCSRKYPAIFGGKFTNKRNFETVAQLDMFGDAPKIIHNEQKYNVNYSSSSQVENIFDRLSLPKPVDDHGKITFGENPIKTYINNNPSSPLKEFLEVLLEYREYDKLLGTYGDKLFDAIDNNGRLRTSYSQCFTQTGRLSCSEILSKRLGLNLANIPKRKDIRSIFIPDPGYSFIDSDFTGQEVILAGDYSKEPVLMKAFKEGFDHHSFLASISYSIIFGKKFEVLNENKEVDVNGFKYNLKKLRDEHKSCLFAKFYGGGKNRVMNVLNAYLVNHIPPEKRLDVADQISKALNRALPVLTEYLRTKVTEVKENGYVIANKLGRRRYFDDVETAFGDAMNMPIQGSGADCVKIALINLDKWITEQANILGITEEEFGWISMTIYDQNLICLNDKYIDMAPEVPRIMAESINWFLTDLTGSSDLNIRKYWSK